MPPSSLLLLYHAIGTPGETAYRDAVTRETFRAQIDRLAARYTVVPLAEMIARQRRGASLAGLAAITFDDNHPSVLEQAIPDLVARGLPATWFLIGCQLEGKPTWRDLTKEVIAAGREEAFLAFARAREPRARALRAEKFYKDSKDPARIPADRMAALLEEFLGPRAAEAVVTAEHLAAMAPAPAIALANHSWHHFLMAGLGEPVQRRELAETQAWLERLGWPLAPAFAVPFGGPDTYDRITIVAATASSLLLTADGLVAADDLSTHPEAPPQRALVRSRPGRFGLELNPIP